MKQKALADEQQTYWFACLDQNKRISRLLEKQGALRSAREDQEPFAVSIGYDRRSRDRKSHVFLAEQLQFSYFQAHLSQLIFDIDPYSESYC